MIIFILLFLVMFVFLFKKLYEFNKIYHFTLRVFIKFLLRRDSWSKDNTYRTGITAIMAKSLCDKNLELPDNFDKVYFRKNSIELYNRNRKLFFKYKPLF